MSKARQPRRYQAVKKRQTIKKQSAPPAKIGFLPFALLAIILAGLVMGFNIYNTSPASAVISPTPTQSLSAPVQTAIEAPVLLDIPTVVGAQPISSVRQRYAFNPLVGIVAGHRGYDPGAVCPDGLTEAEINYRIAVEVVDLLQRQGINADLLEEFDVRLNGYLADALISIHSDSCTIPGASGFKVARVTESAIPEAEDLLVACLNNQYAQYTGLPTHPSSITDGMTDYHAFREINNQTPGAIIEAGFMLDDRYLLESKPKILARGIAAGILCFLDQRLAPAPAN